MFFFFIKPLVAEIKPCWIVNMMAHIWQECFQPLEILMVTIIIWLGLSCCSHQLQKQHFLTELQLVNSVKLLAYEITDDCMSYQIVFNSPFQPHASCCGFSFSHLSRCQWLLKPGREDKSCQMSFLEATASRYASSASHERWRHWPRWTRPRRTERLPPNRKRSGNSQNSCFAGAWKHRGLHWCCDADLDVFSSSSYHKGQLHLPVHLLQSHKRPRWCKNSVKKHHVYFLALIN